MSTSSAASKTSQLSLSDLSPEQQAFIDALYEGNVLGVAGLGFGKAICYLVAGNELLDDGEISRLLIVGPPKVIDLVYATEPAKWGLADIAIATGTEADRSAAIEGDNRIVAMGMNNLAWLFTKYGPDHGFDALFVDEVQRLANVGGANFKKLRPRLKDFKIRNVVTATPVAETPMNAYAIAMIVDQGKRLGRRFDVFKQTYFWNTDLQDRVWEIKADGEKMIAEAIADIVFLADDAKYLAGLPELRDEVIYVDMPDWTLYDEMAEEGLLLLDGHEVVAANAAVIQNKLVQLAQGFYYDDDGGHHDVHYEKFFALDRLVGPGVLVSYEYDWQLAELRRRYPDMLFFCDDPVGAEAAWNAGGRCMAMHPRSGSAGLNLADGGHQLVQLGPIWSAEMTKQLCGRLLRRGQKSSFVRRTIIVTSGTVDELIGSRGIDKNGIEGSFMDHLRSRQK